MCGAGKVITGITAGVVIAGACCLLMTKEAKNVKSFKRTVEKAIDTAVDTISEAAEKIADSLDM